MPVDIEALLARQGPEPLMTTEGRFPGVRYDEGYFHPGKVRDNYYLGGRSVGNNLLMVANDKISVFDVVLPTGIPSKGVLLTQPTLGWVNLTEDIIPNHLISADRNDFPTPFKDDPQLDGRTMLVHQLEMVPVECVVRGYITGSGWSSYKKSGEVCGIRLPEGLRESEELPEPIFTPTTKSHTGHDKPMTFDQVVSLVGEDLAKTLRRVSIDVYSQAKEYAKSRGVIIADTKFEMGFLGDQLRMADELLTPDSSRFWPRVGYDVGRSQTSFDKQFVRDYAESTGWNKQPPGPELPPEIVAKTREKYIEAYQRLFSN